MNVRGAIVGVLIATAWAGITSGLITYAIWGYGDVPAPLALISFAYGFVCGWCGFVLGKRLL